MRTTALAQEPPPAAPIELPPDIQEALLRVPRRNPKAEIRSVGMEVVTGGKTLKIERTFYALENGLIGSTDTLPQTQVHALTFGLIDLVLRLDAKFDQRVMVPIYAGNIFLPFGIQRSMRTTIAKRVTVLTGDLESVVAPTPASKFAFEYDTVTESSRNKRREDHVRNSCEVGTPAEAKLIHPKLPGQYLPVTCQSTLQQTTTTQEFAYIVDAQLYAPVVVGGKESTQEYRITDVGL